MDGSLFSANVLCLVTTPSSFPRPISFPLSVVKNVELEKPFAPFLVPFHLSFFRTLECIPWDTTAPRCDWLGMDGLP